MAWWDGLVSQGDLNPTRAQIKEGLIEIGSINGESGGAIVENAFNVIKWDDLEHTLSLGLTSGGITFTADTGRTDIEADQTEYPIGGEVTTRALTVTTSLAEFSMRNLAFYFNTDVQSSSYFAYSASTTSQAFMAIRGGEDSYKAVRITTVKPKASLTSQNGFRYIVLCRAKIYANGDISLAKDAATLIPIQIVAYSFDHTDTVGYIEDTYVSTDEWAGTAYTDIPSW